MSWKAAFLAQAASDNRVRHLLQSARAEYCHQLHYLQMTSEKLAKGLLADARDAEPPLADPHLARSPAPDAEGAA